MNEERQYQPLTKKIIVEGKEKVVCSFVDIENDKEKTNQCPIHSDVVCVNRLLWNAILKQLNTFEEIYLQPDEQDTKETTLTM